jgi:hypothetical protein
MYPPEDNAPLRDAAPGDRIEHKMLPGFAVTVQEVRPCEGGITTDQDGPHSEYLVINPEGDPEWLCGRDVRKVRP